MVLSFHYWYFYFQCVFTNIIRCKIDENYEKYKIRSVRNGYPHSGPGINPTGGFCRSSMADSTTSKKLSTFLESGIYRFEDSNAVFVDPVRVLNRSYSRFKVCPAAYYSRFFESRHTAHDTSNPRKRKRKQKKTHALNERERAADQRHQVIC